MADQTQIYPELTPKDLEDPTLHRTNKIIEFLYSQLAQTQGITGDFAFTNPKAKSTALPSTDYGLITLGALKKFGGGGSSDPGPPGPPGPPGSSTALIAEYTLTTASTTITGPATTTGLLLVVFVTQDATGGRLIVWDPGTFATMASPNLNLVASKTTIFAFIARSDNLWWPTAYPVLEE